MRQVCGVLPVAARIVPAPSAKAHIPPLQRGHYCFIPGSGINGAYHTTPRFFLTLIVLRSRLGDELLRN